MDMQTIGEKVRQTRKAKGITQEKLANLAGLSTMSIRRYESGERIITDETLQRIADALGVHIFDLTGIGKELDKYVFELDESSLSPDISPSEKVRIVDLLKSNPRDLYNMLSDEDKEEFWKIGRDYKADVEQVAQDYKNLDQWGKRAVCAVISAEQERMRGTEGKDTTPPPPPPESPENGG